MITTVWIELAKRFTICSFFCLLFVNFFVSIQLFRNVNQRFELSSTYYLMNWIKIQLIWRDLNGLIWEKMKNWWKFRYKSTFSWQCSLMDVPDWKGKMRKKLAIIKSKCQGLKRRLKFGDEIPRKTRRKYNKYWNTWDLTLEKIFKY